MGKDKAGLKIHQYLCPVTTYTIIDATIDGVDFFNFKFIPKNKRARGYALRRLTELIREFIDLEVMETDPWKEIARRDRTVRQGR